jgi:hypothetical protein
MGLGGSCTAARRVAVGAVLSFAAARSSAIAEASERSTRVNDFVHVGYAQGMRPGVQLGYRRAVARRVTLGLELEHAFQRAGLWQLPAVMTAARVDIWPMGALQQLFAAAVLGVHAHVFAYERSLHAIAVAPGIEAGWAFTLPRGVTLALAGGMRMVVQVHRDRQICIGRDACPQVRTGVHPRALAMIGYRF